MNILFYVVINSEYPLLKEVALLLKQNLCTNVFFYFNSIRHDLKKEVKDAEKENFNVLANLYNDNLLTDNYLTALLCNDKKSEFFTSIYQQKLIEEKIINAYMDILIKTKINKVIISSNNANYNTPHLIKASHNCNLKVFSFPFGISSQDTYARKFQYNNCNYNFLDYLTGYMFPKWKYIYQKRNYFVASYDTIWIQELLNIAPSNPWSSQGGNVDVIFVESFFMIEYYLKQKLDRSKLVLTGNVYNDKIHRLKLRKKFFYNEYCQKRGLDNRKLMLLVSLPPLMENFLIHPNSEYHSIELALKGLLSPLLKFMDKCNIIISLHPRLKQETIEKLIGNFFIIETKPFHQLIALADLLINCQSSTSSLALGIGVPCIDYDIYRFRFKCYSKAKGLVRVENIKEYIKTLENWINNDLLEQMKERARSEAFYYGINDGQNQTRILNILNI